MNISSIVVTTLPAHTDEVMAALASIEHCEVFFRGEGRIIVTIEGDGGGQELALLRWIQGIPRVVSADLAYTCLEEEREGGGDGRRGGAPV